MAVGRPRKHPRPCTTITDGLGPQQRLFPSPKQSIRARPLLWSVQTRKQQTITQMPVLKPIFHPEEVNMVYETESQEAYTEPVRRAKKRKITEQREELTPVQRVTRSARKAIAPVESHIPIVNAIGYTSKASLPQEPSAATAMPPPKTPSKQQRREIPSSQSPCGTPISISSIHSTRSVARSPLKDRSTNTMNIISPTGTPRRVRWAQTKEVADSMETTLSRTNSRSSSDSLKTELGVFRVPVTHSSQVQTIADSTTSFVRLSQEQGQEQENNPNSIVQVPSSPHASIQVLSSPHSRLQDYDSSMRDSPPINTNPVRYNYTQWNDDPSNQLQLDLARTAQANSHSTASTHDEYEDEDEDLELNEAPSSSPLCITSSQAVPLPTVPDRLDIARPSFSQLPPSSQPRARIAASQATTVPQTQPSPRRSPRRNLPTRRPPPSQSPPSSLPEESQWDSQVRLTDSQLFPESLLQGTIPLPPGMEEEEDYEVEEVDEIEDD